MIYDGTIIIPLQRPITWEGDTLTEVALDFSKVTGRVIIKAERDLTSEGNFLTVRPMSADYCSRIAAMISKVDHKALTKMHAVDFDSIWQTVAAFVGGQDPQKFYDQYSAGPSTDNGPDEEAETDFPDPANTPEE